MRHRVDFWEKGGPMKQPARNRQPVAVRVGTPPPHSFFQRVAQD